MRHLLDQPHHDGSALHVSNPNPDPGDVVSVFLRTPARRPAGAVWVRTTPDAEPKFTQAVVDRGNDYETWWRADISLRNPLTNYRWLTQGAKADANYSWVNGLGLTDHDVPDAHDFAISAHPAPPDWASDSLVYQVFPDRFARSAAAADREIPAWAQPARWDDTVQFSGPNVSSQLFGGDLDGISERLDHIIETGFNTIYLTPFFPAGSIHRYDASTFEHVDPLLGGDEALVRLTSAAHARGVRVIGDLTTNHSGSTHSWFQAALADPSAPEREFYYFGDDGSYEGWYNVPSLPKFRFGPGLQRRLIDGPDSTVGRWLGSPYNLDGWRIDVANMTARRTWEDTNLHVARSIRRTMAEVSPDTVLIAEHCHDASRDLTGEGWHGAMNYAGFMRPMWSWLRSPSYHDLFLGYPVEVPRVGGAQAYGTMRAFQAVTPWRSLVSSWSLLDSHDTPRFRTVVADAAVHEVGAGLLFTSPGAPMVFMGDELGGIGLLGEDARRPMPWDRPDLWDSTTHAVYRKLAYLRSAHTALRRGGLRWVFADDESLAYLRESAEERLFCVAARGAGKAFSVPASGLGLSAAGGGHNLFGGAPDLVVSPHGQVIVDVEGPSFQVWSLTP